MTEEVLIRIEGRAGRITLNRPGALNALTHGMCLAIDAALKDWATDDRVKMLVIDGAGERAFCAGGDIVAMYNAGIAGDFDSPRRFWADEYRMNARLFDFPKPVASFLHGFVMGGGVGVGGHGSHRIVGESSKVAMPECSIGLIPDVGGTLILARAPGRLGEYLGLTGQRMGPGDAIHAGFADYFVPEAAWAALKAEICDSGDWAAIDRAAVPAPENALAAQQAEIDLLFRGETLRDILNALDADGGALAAATLETLARNSPISMAATVELVHRARALPDDIHHALGQEYRFTARSMEHGDFLEGVRAAVIDKDRRPRWRHAGAAALPQAEVTRILLPLGVEAWRSDGKGEMP